jgi:hypothetical protein
MQLNRAVDMGELTRTGESVSALYAKHNGRPMYKLERIE